MEKPLTLQCRKQKMIIGSIGFVYACKKIDLEFVLGIMTRCPAERHGIFTKSECKEADALSFFYNFMVTCAWMSLRQGLAMSCMLLPCVGLSNMRVMA